MSTQEQEKLAVHTLADTDAAQSPQAQDAQPAQDTQAAPDAQAAQPADQTQPADQAAEPASPWQEMARVAQADQPAVQPSATVPPTATAGGGSGGSLPPDTVTARDDDVPAVPEDEEPEEEEDGQGGRMSLMDHLRELRQRICYSLAAAFVGFLICWCFVEPVFDVLTRPLLAVLPEGSSAMYTTLPEAFFTRMYIAFILGLFVASPYIFYQIWAFISPGLYEEEKHFIMPVAFVSAVFFVLGGLFCYFIVFKYAFSFFMTFVTEEIQAMPKISDYLDFVLKLLLAFGFIFEMPIFAFFLSRMGLITAARMRSVRRYAILIIFIVAAILTPPDVVSQILMAVPMLILYEASILVAAVFGKKEAPKTDDEDEDEDDYEDDDYDDEEDEDDDPRWQTPAQATAAAGSQAAPSAAAPAPQSQPVSSPAAQSQTSGTQQPAASDTQSAGQTGSQSGSQPADRTGGNA